VDKCSDAYKYGKYIGDIAGIIVGGRLAKSAIDKTIGNTKFDIKLLGKGNKKFQIRYGNQPIFRIEKHNLGGTRRIHYHRGLNENSMRPHRPYDGGW
jgi:hypothetical protein